MTRFPCFIWYLGPVIGMQGLLLLVADSVAQQGAGVVEVCFCSFQGQLNRQ